MKRFWTSGRYLLVARAVSKSGERKKNPPHLWGGVSTDTNLIEYKTGSPYIDEIVVDDWKLDADGMLSIPKTPGLGLKLDIDALMKYTTKEALGPELQKLLQSRA